MKKIILRFFLNFHLTFIGITSCNFVAIFLVILIGETYDF